MVNSVGRSGSFEVCSCLWGRLRGISNLGVDLANSSQERGAMLIGGRREGAVVNRLSEATWYSLVCGFTPDSILAPVLPPSLLVKILWFDGFQQAAAMPGFYASENVMRSWQLCFALFSSKEKDWEGIRVNPSLGHPHPHPQHPHRLWPFSAARSCS